MQLSPEIRNYFSELGKKSAQTLGEQGRKARASKAGQASAACRKCAKDAQSTAQKVRLP